MIFKSRKGLSQAKKYNKKAKEFWKVGEEQMIEEVKRYINSNTDEKLVKISRNYAKKLGFEELECSKDDIEALRRIIKHFGEEVVITDFIRYATRTGFLTVVIAPALAAVEGIGDMKKKTIDEWLYAIGVCLPVSADVGDSVMDDEILKHPLIPYSTWLVLHKLGAAIIFYIGLDHIENIKTENEKIYKRIIERLGEGLKAVTEKQLLDYEAQKSPEASLRVIEKIYEGKICEIEATVFGTIPSENIELIKIFEEGARNFAGELQVVDDIEDLLGDTNLGKDPKIPNPSFFLTYCIDLWKKNKRDMKKIMEEAMKRTWERGNKYHEKVMQYFDKLPKNFPTKPFFQITLWYYNKVLRDKVKKFLEGETLSDVELELSRILKSLK